MAKKAKLDILEITIDEKSEGTLNDIILEKKEDEGSDEKQTSADILSKIKEWVRKPLFWIILISVGLLCLIAGVFIILHEGIDERVPVEQKKQTVLGIPATAEGKKALFEGFVVDQKDEKGNLWIVFCDVVLELDEPKTAKEVDSDRVDVRNVIYTLLKKETVKEGLSPEGRNRLKERLKSELNDLFGENLVKNIYITRYEMY